MKVPSWNTSQSSIWQILDHLQRLGMRRLTQMGLALGVSVGSAAVACSAPPVELPTYYTQADFRLPFEVGPASRRPKQLDLLVSRDFGVSWRLHQSVPPTARAFDVQGAAEGIYLLTVQARDEATALISQQAMRLVVDRSPPTLAMDCSWDGQEKIDIRCSGRDQSLDMSTILLQFRCDNSATYTALPLESSIQNGNEFSAQGALSLPVCQRFELLLTARDRAGNEGSASQKFDVTSMALPITVPANLNAPAISPQSVAPQVAQSNPQAATSSLAASLVGHRRQFAPLDESRGPDGVDLVTDSSSAFILCTPETTKASCQAPQQSSPTGIMVAAEETGSAASQLVVVADRRFSLAYEITPSQVAVQTVELWGTTDEGLTWEFWGYDDDCVSPCKIEVPALGKYGYCVVVVRAPVDLQLRPRSGDRPDLMVEVREARRAALSVIR